MSSFTINQFITNSTVNFTVDLSAFMTVPVSVEVKRIMFSNAPNNRTMYLVSDLTLDNQGILFPFSCNTFIDINRTYEINEGVAPSFTISVLNDTNQLVQYPSSVGQLNSSLYIELIFNL